MVTTTSVFVTSLARLTLTNFLLIINLSVFLRSVSENANQRENALPPTQQSYNSSISVHHNMCRVVSEITIKRLNI